MRLFMLIMFAGFSRSRLAGAELPYSKYPYAKYPARQYKGKLATPRLITPTQREFRTVIRRGAVKGPNFVGHYTVAEWGCGSNCVVYAVIDAITGAVYDKGCQTQMTVIRAASCISGTAACSRLSKALRYSRSANRAFTSGEVHDSS